MGALPAFVSEEMPAKHKDISALRFQYERAQEV